jgi:5-methylcytosine-specific restriction endonuclease McrA
MPTSSIRPSTRYNVSSLEHKTCCKCKLTKLLSEFYKYREGHQHYCKSCSKVAARKNYAANKEVRIASVRRWQKDHPKECRELHQKDYHKNPAPQKARSVAAKLKRRAVLLGRQFDYGITVEKLFIRDKGICGICKDPCLLEDASVDHILPISRGGHHTWDNVQLAHLTCNKRKGDRFAEGILYNHS